MLSFALTDFQFFSITAKPPQKPLKLAAVEASGSKLWIVKPSRLLSQPPSTSLLGPACHGSAAVAVSECLLGVMARIAFTLNGGLGAEPSESQGVRRRSPPGQRWRVVLCPPAKRFSASGS